MLPLIAYEIADGDEADYPDYAAWPGPQGEGPEIEFAHAGSERGEVAQPGNEIAEEQRPCAIAVEPGIHFWLMTANLFVDPCRALQQEDNARTTQPVTEGDAAEAARAAGQDGGDEREFAVMDGDACEHEDGFVGDERTDDAQHQQAEDGEVAVVREEKIDVFHAASYYPVKPARREWQPERRLGPARGKPGVR